MAPPCALTSGNETFTEMEWRDIQVKGYRKEELYRK
jgi:hypothetical protein